MFALLELVLSVVEFILSWRLIAGLATTFFICLTLLGLLPNDATRWAVCLPIGLAGAALSIWWEFDASRKK